MDSRDNARRESWIQCRRSFEERLAHSPLSAVPLRVIDWAVGRNLADRLYAWLSHDALVLSNRRWDAERADKLVVIPKPDSVELRLYRDAALVRQTDVDRACLDRELDHAVAGFRGAGER